MHTALRSPLRWPAAVLLLVTAGTHVPMVRQHLTEAPYIGVLFIVVAVASLALAMLLLRWDTPVVWGASGLLTLLALVAFLVSRTVGLPEIADEVGNWTEPLGFPALTAEALATVVAATALRRRSDNYRKTTS